MNDRSEGRPVPRALQRSAEFGQQIRALVASEAQAHEDAASFAELLRRCHAEAVDAAALLAAGRGHEARATVDRMVERLDRLIDAMASDASDVATP